MGRGGNSLDVVVVRVVPSLSGSRCGRVGRCQVTRLFCTRGNERPQGDLASLSYWYLWCRVDGPPGRLCQMREGTTQPLVLKFDYLFWQDAKALGLDIALYPLGDLATGD